MRGALRDTKMFDELIETYKRLKAQQDEIAKQLADLRLEWNDRVMQNGNYKSAVGSITIRSGYDTTTYDKESVTAVANALETVAPALAKQLHDARTVKSVGATWAIK